MGDLKRPIWLECETPAGLHVSHIRDAKRLFEAAGVRVIGSGQVEEDIGEGRQTQFTQCSAHVVVKIDGGHGGLGLLLRGVVVAGWA